MHNGILTIAPTGPTIPSDERLFVVTFGRIDKDGPMKPHYCQSRGDLAEFLSRIGLTSPAVDSIDTKMQSGDSYSLRLSLDDEAISLF